MRSRFARAVVVPLALSVMLAGAGTTAAASTKLGSVTASPKTLSFGKVVVGQSSTLSFWLTNDTKAALYVTSIQAGGDNFAYATGATSNDCFDYAANGWLLYPGDSCGNAVTFQPTATGRATGSMSFSFSDGVRTWSLVEGFSGTGT